MGGRSEVVMLWLVLGLGFVSSGSGFLTCNNNLLRDFPMALKDSNIGGTRRIVLTADGVPTRHIINVNAFLAPDSKYCFRFAFSSPSGSVPLTSHEVSLRVVGVHELDATRISSTDQRVCVDEIRSFWRNCCARGIRIEGKAEDSEDTVFTGFLQVPLQCPQRRLPQKFVDNTRTLFYRNKFNSNDSEKITDMDFHELTRVVVAERSSGIQKVRFYKRNGAGDWVLRQTMTMQRVWRVYVKWATVVLLTTSKRMRIYHEISPGKWEQRLVAQTMYSMVGAAVQGSRVAVLTAPSVVSVFVRQNAFRWRKSQSIGLKYSIDGSRYDGSRFELLSFNEDGSLIVLNMKNHLYDSSTRISAELYIKQDRFRRAQVWDSGGDEGAEKFGHGGAVRAKGRFLFISGATGGDPSDHPVVDVFRKNITGRYNFLQKLVPYHAGYPKRNFDIFATQIYVTDRYLVVNDAFILEPSSQPWKFWQTAAVYTIGTHVNSRWFHAATLRRNDRPEGGVGVLNLWKNRITRVMIDEGHVVAVMDKDRKIYSWGSFT